MSQEEEEQQQQPKLEELNVPQQQATQPPKRRNKKRTILNPKQSTGHWSEQEHKTYIDFLNAHRPIMESQDQKKTSKIFKLMSEIIGTRSPSQCRSHHQKFNPFVHQIKKRQKGAGRKKKDINLQSDKIDMRQQYDSQLLPPFFLPQFYPQHFDYSSMLGMQYNPMMYPHLQDNMKDDDKLDNPLFIPSYLLPQQINDDKNPLNYNFGFMPPQVHLNFNYYQTPDLMPQSIEKDNQYEDQ